jgi:HK97 family phage prohead protease
MSLEIRGLPGLEVRFIAGKPRLTGYAAMFNTRSLPYADGAFVEVVKPGAFTRSLTKSDIRAFDGHDQSKILGRQSAGTLVIEEDTKGLRVDITPPDTQVGRDIVENIKLGNLDGMSFGFLPTANGVVWDLTKRPAIRNLTDVDLVEVSVVALPRYPDTSVALRSMPKAGPSIAELKELLAAKTAGWRK